MVPVEQEMDTSNIESPTSSPKKVIATPTTASGRPKRERKLPAHLKAGDFEYSYKGPNDSAATRKKAATVNKQDNDEAKEETNEEQESLSMEIEDEIMNDDAAD